MNDGQIRKWYFALADNTKSKIYKDLAKAAVISAKKNTNLEPHLIYDGKADEFTDWMDAHGVNVIYHQLSFLDKMKGLPVIEVGRGAYLRTDIPLIEKENKYILYTDIDILFLRDVGAYISECRPEFFACCGELDWESLKQGELPKPRCNWFNSGVMVMNVEAMRQEYADFVDFCYKRKFKFGSYDQGALNKYYSNRWDYLDDKLNYRICTSDLVPHPAIVHFHGLKPFDIEAIKNCRLNNQTPNYRDVLINMYKSDPTRYHYYLSLFKYYRYYINHV